MTQREPVSPELAERLREVYGVRARADLEAERGRWQMYQEVTAGRWRKPWPQVLMAAEHALDPLAQAASAVLHLGNRAVVSHETALLAHGITAARPSPVHVTVPYSRGMRSRSGFLVHHGHYPPEHVDRRQDLPVFTLAAAVAQVLCTARSAVALACLDQALAQCPPGQAEKLRSDIAGNVQRRIDPRGHRRAEQLLFLATGRAESPPESFLLLLLADCGFPVPSPQAEVLDPDGSVLYRLDLAWPKLRIAVEYDGVATHDGQQAHDEHRQRRLEARGWIVIRASAIDLKLPDPLLVRIRDAFVRRGAEASVQRLRSARELASQR